MGVWWPLSPIILLVSSSLVDTLSGNCHYPLSLSFSFQILSPKRLTLVDTRKTSDGSRSGWSRFAVCGPVRMVVVIPIWHPPSCGRVVVLEGQQHVSVCMSHLDIFLKVQKNLIDTFASFVFNVLFRKQYMVCWYLDWFMLILVLSDVCGVETSANFDYRQTFQKFSTLQLRELFASWWKAWFEKSAALKISSTLWNATRQGVHSKKWKGSIYTTELKLIYVRAVPLPRNSQHHDSDFLSLDLGDPIWGSASTFTCHYCGKFLSFIATKRWRQEIRGMNFPGHLDKASMINHLEEFDALHGGEDRFSKDSRKVFVRLHQHHMYTV